MDTGVVLVGWIAVQLAFLRELSFFHPTYVVIGAVLIWMGRDAIADWRSALSRP